MLTDGVAAKSQNAVRLFKQNKMAKTPPEDDSAAPRSPKLTSEYDANLLLDSLAEVLLVTDDDLLAEKLQVIPAIVGMIRAGSVRVDRPALLEWLCEATGMRKRDIESLIKQSETPPQS